MPNPFDNLKESLTKKYLGVPGWIWAGAGAGVIAFLLWPRDGETGGITDAFRRGMGLGKPGDGAKPGDEEPSAVVPFPVPISTPTPVPIPEPIINPGISSALPEPTATPIPTPILSPITPPTLSPLIPSPIREVIKEITRVVTIVPGGGGGVPLAPPPRPSTPPVLATPEIIVPQVARDTVYPAETDFYTVGVSDLFHIPAIPDDPRYAYEQTGYVGFDPIDFTKVVQPDVFEGLPLVGELTREDQERFSQNLVNLGLMPEQPPTEQWVFQDDPNATIPEYTAPQTAFDLGSLSPDDPHYSPGSAQNYEINPDGTINFESPIGDVYTIPEPEPVAEPPPPEETIGSVDEPYIEPPADQFPYSEPEQPDVAQEEIPVYESSPLPEPEPEPITPEPGYSEPEPSYSEPEPTPEPEPSSSEPEPEPSYTEPEPSYTEPEPPQETEPEPTSEESFE